MRASERRYWLPGLEVLANYQRSWLRYDLLAGVVLTALLIPAGMGYAEASGLPPETGLYATIVPLLVYALVGPSRVLILGPDSALAPIIAASVLPLAAGDPDRAVALAGLLAIMMGVLLLVGGVLHLGFVTDLLSKPIRVGYLNGIAVVVIVGQLPKLLGFTNGSDSFVGDIRGRGLLIGIELVADRDSNAPADAALAGVIKNAAMDEGLILYPGGGTADGVSGAHIMLAPPFIYNEDHVDELITKLGQVLAKSGLH